MGKRRGGDDVPQITVRIVLNCLLQTHPTKLAVNWTQDVFWYPCNNESQK